eukprot:3263360-Amphidinium_carterae.1
MLHTSNQPFSKVYGSSIPWLRRQDMIRAALAAAAAEPKGAVRALEVNHRLPPSVTIDIIT